MMKRGLFAVWVVGALMAQAGVATAQCTSQTVGHLTYHNCSDGRSGTSQTINGTTYHNFNTASGTSQTIGGITYHNFGERSSTSQTINGTTYHNGTDDKATWFGSSGR